MSQTIQYTHKALHHLICPLLWLYFFHTILNSDHFGSSGAKVSPTLGLAVPSAWNVLPWIFTTLAFIFSQDSGQKPLPWRVISLLSWPVLLPSLYGVTSSHPPTLSLMLFITISILIIC